jgi:hypothetical protein
MIVRFNSVADKLPGSIIMMMNAPKKQFKPVL